MKGLAFLLVIAYNIIAGRDTLYTRVPELTFKRYVISSSTRDWPPIGRPFFFSEEVELWIFMYIPISEGSPVYYVNILATRNRKSGNLEIGVPVLGNRLFYA